MSVNVKFGQGSSEVLVSGQINGLDPPSAGTAGRVFLCNRTGGAYTVNYLYTDDGSTWNETIPSNGSAMVVTIDLSGLDNAYTSYARYIYNSSSWHLIGFDSDCVLTDEDGDVISDEDGNIVLRG